MIMNCEFGRNLIWYISYSIILEIAWTDQWQPQPGEPEVIETYLLNVKPECTQPRCDIQSAVQPLGLYVQACKFLRHFMATELFIRIRKTLLEFTISIYQLKTELASKFWLHKKGSPYILLVN